jgi:hypothetical protein
MEIILRPVLRRDLGTGTQRPEPYSARFWMGWTTWWLWRGARTRSHPELGRENPQRPWYCVSRRGRVGRCQVLQPIPHPGQARGLPTNAGWSSPVARQAHNLKVIGSNPIPATILICPTRAPVGGGSGIRTHGTLARTHAFQACALSRSAIPPRSRK